MNVSTLINVLWPELILTAAACVLFLLGVSMSSSARRLAPVIAVAVLIGVFFALLFHTHAQETAAPGTAGVSAAPLQDFPQGTLIVGNLATYIKMITAGLGILFVLMAWPTNRDATGNSALEFGSDAGEFFALMLLSLTGVFLVAGANDIMLLFLGIELASIPTYIMVSISRPLPIAQEAGVKYFFLGAMAAALMLFGFSYLYGTTGQTKLDDITLAMRDAAGAAGTGGALGTWQLLAVVMLLVGFSFKIAAVPLHEYAGDVYQGAATPVTAFLAYVPKVSGFIAIIKILAVVNAALPATSRSADTILYLLWIVALLTMTFGNALAVTSQYNIKRVLAYSSVANSGYMLVGLTAMLAARGVVDPADPRAGASLQQMAVMGVLFYLCAYGIMNTGAFGVLMMLPGRADAPGRSDSNGRPLPTAGSAETFDDIAGQGRRHPMLGLAMLVCCLSLTGIPLTIGFFGKVLLIKPAWAAMSNPEHGRLMGWLVVAMVINATVSAGYYLRIVVAMYLRPEHVEFAAAGTTRSEEALPRPIFHSVPVAISIVLSVVGTLFYGIYLPGAAHLTGRAARAAELSPRGDVSSAQAISESHVYSRSGR